MADDPYIPHLYVGIEMWKNNHKGSTYMWAERADLGLGKDVKYPDIIDVRGRHETHRWEWDVLTDKSFEGVWYECARYVSQTNIMYLYLALRKE